MLVLMILRDFEYRQKASNLDVTKSFAEITGEKARWFMATYFLTSSS
jgi:hypothetical protein